jgi:Immunity protein 53
MSFDSVKIERSDEDWVHVWVEDHRWHAACGPLNLDEALGMFLGWAASS